MTFGLLVTSAISRDCLHLGGGEEQEDFYLAAWLLISTLSFKKKKA